jgi:hypothetical protein
VARRRRSAGEAEAGPARLHVGVAGCHDVCGVDIRDYRCSSPVVTDTVLRAAGALSGLDADVVVTGDDGDAKRSVRRLAEESTASARSTAARSRTATWSRA